MIPKLKNIVKIKIYLLKNKLTLSKLRNELIKGENSGFVKNFNRKKFLNNLHKNI
jgi:hypothetical protein